MNCPPLKRKRGTRNIRITEKGYAILEAIDRGLYSTAARGRNGRSAKRDARGRFAS